MDSILAVLLGVAIYTVLCVFIAAARALFSKSGKKAANFKETFWTFFLEVVNPFHWFG